MFDNNSINIAEKRINELEDKSVEIIQFKPERDRKGKED